MKIEFKSEDLRGIVNRACQFAAPNALDIKFGYLVFDGTVLRAGNDKCGLHQTLPIDFGKRLLLESELLKNIITALDGNMSLTINEADSDVTAVLKAAKSRSLTKFQKNPNLKESVWFDLPNCEKHKLPDGFFNAMIQTFFVIQGRYPFVKFDGTTFYGTDGGRLARFKPIFQFDKSFLISQSLLACISPETTAPLIEYCIVPGERSDQLWFFFEGFSVYVDDVTFDPPDYAKMFLGFETNTLPSLVGVNFDRAKVLEVIERLSFIKTGEGIDIRFVNDQMILMVKGSSGVQFEHLPFKSPVEGIFSINFLFFKEAIERSEKLWFHPTNYREPIYFQSSSGLDIIVMPMVPGNDERTAMFRRSDDYLKYLVEAEA